MPSLKEIRQKQFNKAVKHILKQGRPAANKQGTCLYRTRGGLRCAIGALIPDSCYTPKFEGHSLLWIYRNPSTTDKLPSSLRIKNNQEFLMGLQYVHDHASGLAYSERDPKKFLPAFVKKAREFAHIYKLNTSVLPR